MAFLDVSNKRIYYEVHGEGEPLILLNGIMMNTASWHMFLPDFKKFQVILLDFFDQGQSDLMTLPYTHHIQVNVVEAVVKALNLATIHLIGISYGAEIALEYTLKHPDHIKTLIIFNGAAKTSNWLKDIGIAWQLAARTYQSDLFYHVTIPYIYSSQFYSHNEAWFANRKEQLLQVFDTTFLGKMDRLIESSSTYDILDHVSNITCNTYIIAGDCDYITPLEESKILHDAIMHSQLTVLNQCGHASMYEKPNEFVYLILKAIDENHR